MRKKNTLQFTFYYFENVIEYKYEYITITLGLYTTYGRRFPLDIEMLSLGRQGCTSQRRHQTSNKRKPLCKMVIFIRQQL